MFLKRIIETSCPAKRPCPWIGIVLRCLIIFQWHRRRFAAYLLACLFRINLPDLGVTVSVRTCSNILPLLQRIPTQKMNQLHIYPGGLLGPLGLSRYNVIIITSVSVSPCIHGNGLGGV